MIRIGFTGSASFNPIVPSVIQDYRGRYPGIAVSLVESGTSQLIDSIRAGRVDAAFIRTPLREVDGLVVAAILEEEMLIALPAGHALAASASVALAALSGEPFICFRGPAVQNSTTTSSGPAGALGACGRPRGLRARRL
jgi:DNA-binding transcriptional LysR family regulator